MVQMVIQLIYYQLIQQVNGDDSGTFIALYERYTVDRESYGLSYEYCEGLGGAIKRSEFTNSLTAFRRYGKR